MAICLERDADLHMAQLMPLPLTVCCFSKIQIGFTFLVPAYLDSPGKGLLNGCVCVRACVRACVCTLPENLILMLILIAGFHKLLILINWLQNSQLPITASLPSQCCPAPSSISQITSLSRQSGIPSHPGRQSSSKQGFLT